MEKYRTRSFTLQAEGQTCPLACCLPHAGGWKCGQGQATRWVVACRGASKPLDGAASRWHPRPEGDKYKFAGLRICCRAEGRKSGPAAKGRQVLLVSGLRDECTGRSDEQVVVRGLRGAEVGADTDDLDAVDELFFLDAHDVHAHGAGLDGDTVLHGGVH